MSTQAQIDANRSNSQKSTGPVTAEGKAASSRNAISHGLTLDEDKVFTLPQEDQEQYDEIIQGLRPQIKPNGFLEEKLFLAYCWAIFQADRARGLEAVWQDRWMNDADNEKVLKTMERMAKYRQAHERSAERARKELSKVQHDAYCANQPNAVLKSVGLEKEKLSVLLPVSEIRKHEFKLCNATRVAGEAIHGLPDWQDPSRGNFQNEPKP